MKLPLYKDLNEVFTTNSLKNMTTPFQRAMPHKGNEFYIWNELRDDDEISLVLNKGNFWKPHTDSVSSYISLSEDCYENKYYGIENGPNSTSSSNTVRVMENEFVIRLIAYGWGTSFIVLWEGPREDFLTYLTEKQVR